jgi:DNA-directed RNA polymerase sigma subunit (sigma70/sigma32)
MEVMPNQNTKVRYPEHVTQADIARRLGVHRSRIGQIEKQAMAKLRAEIIREAALAGMSVRDWLFGDSDYTP